MYVYGLHCYDGALLRIGPSGPLFATLQDQSTCNMTTTPTKKEYMQYNINANSGKISKDLNLNIGSNILFDVSPNSIGFYDNLNQINYLHNYSYSL
jgi:hypothetical protein